MLHSRAVLYFDEVARHGSIRKAADRLRIAASAIDRQLLQLEHHVGAPLFERTPQGMRLTAAGELLVDVVRRTRRDMDRVRSHIDDLQGLRRGRVAIATVEGATDFLGRILGTFRESYPAIQFRMVQVTAQRVVDLVLADECDFGLTLNPKMNQSIRIERTVAYRIGLVVPRAHPLAGCAEIALGACADLPLIVPDDTLSLRAVIDRIWAKKFGDLPFDLVEASSIAAVKTLVRSGLGVALLTALDVMEDDHDGGLVYIPLEDEKIPLSVLSLVTRSARSLSVAASLLVNSIAGAMAQQEGLSD
jgi:DNA-binding transcriptional LysR family regulator